MMGERQCFVTGSGDGAEMHCCVEDAQPDRMVRLYDL